MFGRPRVERLSSHLDRVIEAIVSSPDAKVEDLDILPGEERRRILEEFSEGPAMPAPTQTVIDLFAAQALRNPARTAVVFEQRSLSYEDLSTASARLAGRIRRAGIRPGSVSSPGGGSLGVDGGGRHRHYGQRCGLSSRSTPLNHASG